MPVPVANSDEAWAQQAKTDGQAFAELVHRYADRIFNLTYRMTGDRMEAEDLAQETFLRAYHGLPRYNAERPFGAWLYRIAVNVCLTQRRRQQVHVEPLPPDQADALLDHVADTATIAEQRETQAAVQQAILSLPPMYRVVIILYHIEGRSYNEIAALLDLPLNTVRTHLHRGRALLRERITRRERRV